MSPLVIVIITALVILFLLLLVLAAGILIWISLRGWRFLTSFQKTFEGLVGKFEKEMGERLDKIGKQLEVQGADLNAVLEKHRSEIAIQIAKINGEELSKAVRQMGHFVNRAEMAALAMGDMAKAMLSEQEVRRIPLGPEEYAQPDPEGRFIGQSKVAALDTADDTEQRSTDL